jgi:hypothetical protein
MEYIRQLSMDGVKVLVVTEALAAQIMYNYLTTMSDWTSHDKIREVNDMDGVYIYGVKIRIYGLR